MRATAPVFAPKLYSNALHTPSPTHKMNISVITPPNSDNVEIEKIPILPPQANFLVTPPESPSTMAKQMSKDEFAKELDQVARSLGLVSTPKNSRISVSDAKKTDFGLSVADLTLNARSPPRGPAKWIQDQKISSLAKGKFVTSKSFGSYKTPIHRRGQSSTNSFVTSSTITDPCLISTASTGSFSPISTIETQFSFAETRKSDVFGQNSLTVGNFRNDNPANISKDYNTGQIFDKRSETHLDTLRKTLDKHRDYFGSIEKTFCKGSSSKASVLSSATIGHEASSEIKRFAASTWSRVNSNIRHLYPADVQHHRVCPYVPRQFSEYVDHVEEMTELRNKAVNNINSNRAENKAVSLKHGEIGLPFDGKVFGSANGDMKLNSINRGAVLGQETIWCNDPYPPWHFEAGWPCSEEFKWEGDSRIATEYGIFRRFMPLSRVSREHPLWEEDYRMRPLNEMHTFDNIWPIPDMSDVYLPVDEIEDSRISSLINQSLLAEIDNLVL